MGLKGLSFILAICCLSPPSLGTDVQSDVQEIMLEFHNDVRPRHQAKQLVLDCELNNRARKCAEYYVHYDLFDHSCKDKVVNGKKAGENLAKFWSSEPLNSSMKAKESCQGWYDEWTLYKYDNPNMSIFTSWGHFSQMVWKNSSKMGVGMAVSPRDKSMLFVALYQPTGNLRTRPGLVDYIKNVSPIKRSSKTPSKMSPGISTTKPARLQCNSNACLELNLLLLWLIAVIICY